MYKIFWRLIQQTKCKYKQYENLVCGQKQTLSARRYLCKVVCSIPVEDTTFFLHYP